jgi:hypothetical protein
MLVAGALCDREDFPAAFFLTVPENSIISSTPPGIANRGVKQFNGLSATARIALDCKTVQFQGRKERPLMQSDMISSFTIPGPGGQ